MNALSHAPAVPAKFDSSKQRRNSMLGKLAIGWKAINMVEADYRQAMFERTGQTSAANCTDAQLETMLEFLKSKGFRPIPKPGKAKAQHPMARKARAMWISLYQLGAVHNASEEALEGFAKRQLKCEKLVWARQSDARSLIEALKAMATRHGWPQPNLPPIQLQASLCEAILAKLKDKGIAPADWSIHDAQHKLCGIDKREAWTAEDYQRLAEALGQKLRAAGPMEARHG